MGSTFGKLFRVTTFGESHGPGIGAVIDGCPGSIPFDLKKVQAFLDRRRPGQSQLSSPRSETDQVQVLSGVENGFTLGSPICFFVPNIDQRKKDYEASESVFRPSHADYTYFLKYGINSQSGGGRSSARETLARVAAGALAQMLLEHLIHPSVAVYSWVDEIQEIKAQVDLSQEDTLKHLSKDFDELPCPDLVARKKMIDRILEVKAKSDTVGGVISCVIKNCPKALGEPVMDKFEADLAKAMMSLPASKGFEIGSGFKCSALLGSEHNDLFVQDEKGHIRTKTNHSGGVQGGITNGEDVYFRVAFKPPSTVFLPQQTVNKNDEVVNYIPKGRHDPCVLPRAVPIVEAMAWIVVADNFLNAAPFSISKP